ncbi:MAG: DUF6785 family protein [Armatimonadota bacterium]
MQTASVTLLMEVVIMHDPREHPMPAVANAYSLARPSLLPARWLTGALVLSLCVGFASGFRLCRLIISIWKRYFGLLRYQYGSSLVVG